MVKMKRVCNDVLHYLKAEYEKKGCNFYFTARKLDIPQYSNHLKGNALGLLKSSGKIEKWSHKKSPLLYKTRF